jgi:hypothetical protein
LVALGEQNKSGRLTVRLRIAELDFNRLMGTTHSKGIEEQNAGLGRALTSGELLFLCIYALELEIFPAP